jgi:hypothetical protein
MQRKSSGARFLVERIGANSKDNGAFELVTRYAECHEFEEDCE